MKKTDNAEIQNIIKEALDRGAKAAAVIDIINKFDAYVPDYQLAEMNIPKAWSELERRRDERRETLRRGDLKPDKRYKVVKQHGSDGRKPRKKEIAERLGLSRTALYTLLENPDNGWGLKTDYIQSWQAFDYYCETHKAIIDQHKANPKSKIRKSRAKLVLTKTGNMSDLSQSATQNFKPHSRTIAKPK